MREQMLQRLSELKSNGGFTPKSTDGSGINGCTVACTSSTSMLFNTNNQQQNGVRLSPMRSGKSESDNGESHSEESQQRPPNLKMRFHRDGMAYLVELNGNLMQPSEGGESTEKAKHKKKKKRKNRNSRKLKHQPNSIIGTSDILIPEQDNVITSPESAQDDLENTMAASFMQCGVHSPVEENLSHNSNDFYVEDINKEFTDAETKNYQQLENGFRCSSSKIGGTVNDMDNYLINLFILRYECWATQYRALRTEPPATTPVVYRKYPRKPIPQILMGKDGVAFLYTTSEEKVKVATPEEFVPHNVLTNWKELRLGELVWAQWKKNEWWPATVYNFVEGYPAKVCLFVFKEQIFVIEVLVAHGVRYSNSDLTLHCKHVELSPIGKVHFIQFARLCAVYQLCLISIIRLMLSKMRKYVPTKYRPRVMRFILLKIKEIKVHGLSINMSGIHITTIFISFKIKYAYFFLNHSLHIYIYIYIYIG
uniref:PWWP domain-containing protein n=1 Tax=Heterorhabditis bacteriophora TaxID=37862 RepID=A0A1I7WX23_HETBA